MDPVWLIVWVLGVENGCGDAKDGEREKGAGKEEKRIQGRGKRNATRENVLISCNAASAPTRPDDMSISPLESIVARLDPESLSTTSSLYLKRVANSSVFPVVVGDESSLKRTQHQEARLLKAGTGGTEIFPRPPATGPRNT